MKLFLVLAMTFALSACTYVSPETKANFATSRISSALDLNKEQKAKATEIKDLYLQIRASYAPQRKADFERIKELVGGDKLDPVPVKAMLAQRQKMFDENFDKVFVKVAELHATLSPEQKKNALEMLDKYSKFFE